MPRMHETPGQMLALEHERWCSDHAQDPDGGPGVCVRSRQSAADVRVEVERHDGTGAPEIVLCACRGRQPAHAR